MAKPNTEPSFESLMKRIEQLTEQLEDPSTGIEQSLGLYEEAMKLVGQAQTRLADIQHKFEVIGQKGATGLTSEVNDKKLPMFPEAAADSDQQDKKDNVETSQNTLL